MLLSRQFQTSSNVENLHPQIIKQVVKELTSLSSDPPEGIKVFTNDEDVTDIQATIEGPGWFFHCLEVLKDTQTITYLMLLPI